MRRLLPLLLTGLLGWPAAGAEAPPHASHAAGGLAMAQIGDGFHLAEQPVVLKTRMGRYR